MSEFNFVLRLRPRGAFVLFVVLDLFCTGVGMGVPVFNIAFGFVVGWYIVRWVSSGTREIWDILKRLLLYACITSCVTLVGMIVIWGPSVMLLYDGKTDLAKFGTPQILFEPGASFIGWLVLMMAISPFLQMLTTIFGGHIALLSTGKREGKSEAYTGTTA
jgi:hypothetical protein